MEYAITRLFTKRETEKSGWGGRIGTAELKFASESDIVVTLDGQVLPVNSVEYLMEFSLQSLQDAYAGADSLENAINEWNGKRDKLLDGTIGTRGGSGLSDEDYAKMHVARAAFIENKGKDAWKAMDEDAQSDTIATIIHKNGEKDWFTAAVERRVAEVVEARKRRAAEKAGLKAVKADLDL